QAVLEEETAVPDERRVDRNPRRVHRRVEAVEAGPRAEKGHRTPDHRDPAVAELDQMPGRGEATTPVARPHRGRAVQWLAGGVEGDQRDAGGGEPRLLPGRERCVYADDAHGAPGEDLV